MLDPFPIAPPPALVSLIKPFADALSLQTLPIHAHEILFATGFYFFICYVFAPWISRSVCPARYSRMTPRGQLNWDVHIVSFVQACLINGLSLYVIWYDEERMSWRPKEHWQDRIYGYYGSGGLCQSFALGYFLWDLCMCTFHIDIFGWGMLAHAISAVSVFALGYRPYIYFSAPIFLLYELSSPFLNIHWFCDKLDLTGSTIQAVNGAFLVSTFFCCRLVWGIYSSIWVFRDMYWLVRDGNTNFSCMVPSGKMHVLSTSELLAVAKDPILQQHAFNHEQYIPIWIPIAYLVSNLVLNSLNVFWFGKMIETIRKRFDPPFGTKGVGEESAEGEKLSRPKLEERLDSDLGVGMPGKKKEALPKLEDNEVDSDQGVSTPGKKKRGNVKKAMNGPVGSVDDTHADGSADTTGSARRSARSRRNG